MGHIKVLGGPHVARGPDVAHAWVRVYNQTTVAKVKLVQIPETRRSIVEQIVNTKLQNF